MLELAELIIKLTNSKSEIEFKPLPSDDPKQRRPDITMVSEKLGWKPTVELKEGLLKTISDFQTRLQK
jgi:UDP-glucuronate decarboxylase